MVIDDPEIIEIFQNQFINLWTNKYSSERTKELFSKAKVNFLTVFPPPAQSENKVININSASQEELIGILQISEPLTQLPELTTLKWEEWKEQGIEFK